MAYPFPLLIPQVQFRCTSEEYWRIVKLLDPDSSATPFAKRWKEYSQILPLYTYARCPICLAEYRGGIDTYSVRFWKNSVNMLHTEVYGELNSGKCNHFVGMVTFPNLHGQVPEGHDTFDNGTGEIPFITADLVPDHLVSYAVLHGLPICRTEDNEFSPTYTMFFLVYFGRDPQQILKYRYDRQSEFGKNDPEFYAADVDPVGTPSDLGDWALRGKLGWLEVTEPELPLRIGKGLILPSMYRVMQGKRRSYYWERPGWVDPEKARYRMVAYLRSLPSGSRIWTRDPEFQPYSGTNEIVIGTFPALEEITSNSFWLLCPGDTLPNWFGGQKPLHTEGNYILYKLAE